MTHIRISDKAKLSLIDQHQTQTSSILKSEGRKARILKPITELKRDSIRFIVRNNCYKDASLGKL
jgi:hypothetical protein